MSAGFGVQQRYGKWIDQGASRISDTKNIKVRIVAIPPAGMGAWAYHAFQSKLPETIEILPVELPGRNTRMAEKRIESMDQVILHLIDALSTTVFKKDSVPFIVFGHSLGALMAYELTQALIEKSDLQSPIALVVSAVRPPHLSALEFDADQETPSLANLSSSHLFWYHFEKRYGKNPDLQSKYIQQYIEPLLRNDFALLENYQGPSSPIDIGIPVLACSASNDNRCPPEQLAEWRHYAPSHFYGPSFFETKPLQWSTAHRYIVEDPQQLIDLLASFCLNDLPPFISAAASSSSSSS